MTGSACADRILDMVAVTGGHFLLPNRPNSSVASDIALARLGVTGQDWSRRLDPFSVQAVLAVAAARVDAGLVEPDESSRDTLEGVCVGTAFGAQQTRVRFAKRMMSHGLANSNPIDFPDSVDGAPAAHVAAMWGLHGPSLTFVNGKSSAVDALVGAARQLAFKKADRMYVVMGDVLEPRLRQAIGKNSPCHKNDASGSPAEPMDAVLALVLEQRNLRQVQPDLSLVGFINSCDGERFLDAASRESEITASDKDSSQDDVSGVMSVAGAWLGVADPMGNKSPACQDEAMSRTSHRRLLPNGLLPKLAFLGRTP